MLTPKQIKLTLDLAENCNYRTHHHKNGFDGSISIILLGETGGKESEHVFQVRIADFINDDSRPAVLHWLYNPSEEFREQYSSQIEKSEQLFKTLKSLGCKLLSFDELDTVVGAYSDEREAIQEYARQLEIADIIRECVRSSHRNVLAIIGVRDLFPGSALYADFSAEDNHYNPTEQIGYISVIQNVPSLEHHLNSMTGFYGYSLNKSDAGKR